MSFTRTQVVIVGIVFILIIAAVLMFMGIIPGLRSNEPTDIIGSLTVWGVYDSKPIFEDTLIKEYQKIHPGVSISYRQLNPETYEEDLIDALASGVGPDIFMIHNTWVPEHRTKILGLNDSQYPLANLRAAFPTVVEQDFYSSSTIYAFPLYIDTLALFYNKGITDNAGIANPPKTWEELDSLIPRLRQINSDGKITRPAVALGGSAKSISNMSDILSLRFLQDGVAMTSADFDETVFALNGEPTLRHYTSFANPGSSRYTWTDSFPSSIDALSNESAVMAFGYSHQIPLLKEKNPFLNFAASPMLQREASDRDVNYADYWGLAVSAVSPNSGLAWDFVGTVTLNPEIIKGYLSETKKHPALRSLIEIDSQDPEYGFFSRQSLTAKSWYQIDSSATSDIFSNMVEVVISGRTSAATALNNAEEAINQIFKRQSDL